MGEVRELLRETMNALEHFDVPALERLLERAEQTCAGVARGELTAAKVEFHALHELLAATERNLKMLQRMRGERNAGGEWVL